MLGDAIQIVKLIRDILGLTKDVKSATSDPDSVLNNMPKKKYRIRHVKRAVTDVVQQIKKDEFVPSIIIGIGRGGGIFGSFISYQLYHTPVVVVDREYDWSTKKRKQKELFDFDIPAFFLDKVLLVAGEVHSGNTIECFEKHMKSKGAGIIKTCVFYKQSGCNFTVDYFSKEGDGFPLMPWQSKGYIRDSKDKKNKEKLQELRQTVYGLEGKTVYIIRHGQTDNNRNDVFIGVTESNLNTMGKQQIEKLANYLVKTECLRSDNSLILTSDQERCIKTSRIISERAGVKVCEDKNLRERNYGLWEGKNRQEIQMESPIDYENYEKDPLSTCPPGADSLLTIIGNIYRVLDSIEKLDDKKINDIEDIKNIVIVTHKTTGRLLLSYFTRTFYSKFREIGFDNGSVSKFVIEKGEIKAQYLNKTEY